MAIDIFWATTKRIFVPRADMPIVQASPEIRELDVNALRLALKDLEAAVEGAPWPDTHRHVTETTLSGAVYARLIEILPPYTVELEDGQYSVRAVGANHNLLDVKINNQVSLAVQNSAGLINSPDIQYSSFDGKVSILPGSPYAGSTFPTGTPRRPVNNLTDALAIAAERGFTTLRVLDDMTLSSGNFQGLRIEAVNREVRVTVGSAAQVAGCQFHDLTLTGTLDGDADLRNCIVETLSVVEGIIQDSALRGTLTLGSGSTSIINCWDDISGVGTPTIDFNGSGASLIVREYRGGLVLQNKSGSEEVSLNLDGGRVTCAADFDGSGSVIVHGVGTITSSGTAPIDDSRLLNPPIAVQTNVAAGSTSSQVRTGLTAPDGYYDGMLLEVQHGGSAYVRSIDRYRNADGAFYLGKNFPFTPVAGERVRVLLTFYAPSRGRAG